MEIVLLVFFVLLVVASALGWTADSRRGTDRAEAGARRGDWPAYPG